MKKADPPGIRADANVLTAAKFLVFWDGTRIDVYDDASWIGRITQRDLIRFLAEGRDLYNTNLADLLKRLGRPDRLDRAMPESPMREVA